MTLAPWAGLPEMNFGITLGAAVGGNALVGWLVHAAIGVTLAWLYALLVQVQCLPGPAPVRGAFYALYPWVIGELLVLPFLGAPVLGGSSAAVVGGLAVHLLYGATLGCLYGEGIVVAPPAAARRAHPYRTAAPRPHDAAVAGDARHAEHGPRSIALPVAKLAATKHQLATVRALVDEFERGLRRAEDARSARAQLLRALTRLSCCGRDLAATMVEQTAESSISNEDALRR